MNAEIITVGTELLLGDILNTNCRFLSQQLASMGIGLLYQSTVGDNAERLAAALSAALGAPSLLPHRGAFFPRVVSLRGRVAVLSERGHGTPSL